MHPGVANEDAGRNADGIRNGAAARRSEILEGLESEPSGLAQGLSRLGIQRGWWCKRFFRSTDPGALFGGAGELVCVECHSCGAAFPPRTIQLRRAARDRKRSRLLAARLSHRAHGSQFERLQPDQAVKFELLRRNGGSPHHCAGEIPLHWIPPLAGTYSPASKFQRDLWSGYFVGVVVLLLCAPAEYSCLMQQSARFGFSPIDPFPLRKGMLAGSIASSAPRQSILQHSRRMLEQTLILFAF